MPRSNNDQVPARYVVDGAWPDAVLAGDAPVSAHYGQALAANLDRAMKAKGRTLRRLAEESGVSHTTISRVLRGDVLPDMGTIARLEVALAVEVFPKQPSRSEPHARMLPVHSALQELATQDAVRLVAADKSVRDLEKALEVARAELASARLRADASDRAARATADFVAHAALQN